MKTRLPLTSVTDDYGAGGLATGGVGLVVGGLVGGGAGTAVAGLTGNRDIEIPAESIVRFNLADDLVVQPA